MITSSGNAQIKRVIQLNKKARERKNQRLFVAEGWKMLREAPREWLERVYVAESSLGEHSGLLDGIAYEIVEDKIFAQMSDTMTPQGVLCLVRMPSYTREDIVRGEHPLCLVLEDLQDPGNVGTILRTAEGAGVTGIVLSKNTVDLFNPKTIRSTMGSIYRMPFLYLDQVEEILPVFREKGIRTYAAHLRGRASYDEEDYTGGAAFFIGNEGNGLSDRLSDQADCLIRIPMEGRVESLNAAVASAILMYEAGRQRRSGKPG